MPHVAVCILEVDKSGRFVRMADIDVHCTEGLFRSLSFESERYSPHAYHRDDIAF